MAAPRAVAAPVSSFSTYSEPTPVAVLRTSAYSSPVAGRTSMPTTSLPIGTPVMASSSRMTPGVSARNFTRWSLAVRP